MDLSREAMASDIEPAIQDSNAVNTLTQKFGITEQESWDDIYKRVMTDPETKHKCPMRCLKYHDASRRDFCCSGQRTCQYTIYCRCPKDAKGQYLLCGPKETSLKHSPGCKYTKETTERALSELGLVREDEARGALEAAVTETTDVVAPAQSRWEMQQGGQVVVHESVQLWPLLFSIMKAASTTFKHLPGIAMACYTTYRELLEEEDVVRLGDLLARVFRGEGPYARSNDLARELNEQDEKHGRPIETLKAAYNAPFPKAFLKYVKDRHVPIGHALSHFFTLFDHYDNQAREAQKVRAELQDFFEFIANEDTPF